MSISTFPNRLKAERKRIGLSQLQFANKLGICKRSQLSYELAQRSPNINYINCLSKEFPHIDISYLITGNRSIPKATSQPFTNNNIFDLTLALDIESTARQENEIKFKKQLIKFNRMINDLQGHRDLFKAEIHDLNQEIQSLKHLVRSHHE